MVSRLALAKAAFGDARRDRIAHRRRHEFMDVAAKDRDFLDQPRRDRLQADIGHKEYRFDPVVELLVNPRHLLFIFEIGYEPKPADDADRPLKQENGNKPELEPAAHKN